MPILKKLSGAERITVGPCDGTRTLAHAKDIFVGGIDSDFVKWKTDAPGKPTPETEVTVCEMEEDATFQEMFDSLTLETNNLAFEQDQIIDFVVKHQKWLRTDGYATFFLFQVGGKFFVADVVLSSDLSLGVDVFRFGSGRVLRAGYRRRVVVPQLKL